MLPIITVMIMVTFNNVVSTVNKCPMFFFTVNKFIVIYNVLNLFALGSSQDKMRRGDNGC